MKSNIDSSDARKPTGNGDGLIFLLSQPRCGSTMLQRILGGHPDVHTVAEPWLMLTPFDACWKGGGLYERLEMQRVHCAHQDFLSTIPRGQEEFIKAVRQMYGYLYERALEASGKRFFLDKTPRYYWIIPELFATFPAARFLILLRNPMAVVSSILQLRIARRWIYLREWKGDLIDAPALIVQAIDSLGANAHVVHYEALVSNPEDELQSICQFLNIPFFSEMSNYGNSGLPKYYLGDPVNVYKHSAPSRDYADAWQGAVRDPQVWRILSDYLELLGPELIGRMEYRHEELRSILDARRPSRLRLATTLPLHYIMRSRVEHARFLYYDLLRMLGSARRRGISRTVRLAYRRLASDIPRD
jgi:Sulfotransferase family